MALERTPERAYAMERKIADDLGRSYGLYPTAVAPVQGGWLNRKWKIQCEGGPMLVKQYSYERFSAGKLTLIEEALERQMRLEERGVPCPHILPYEGRAIRFLDGGTAYMVMRYCPGRIVNCDTVTEAQMCSLGSVCGQIHREFMRLPRRGVRGYPLYSGGLAASLREHLRTCEKTLTADVPQAYRSAVRGQEAILRSLTDGCFDGCPLGIAHEDFTPDNMLFLDDEVSAVLDFDRNQYSFLWHDVARALLSLALKDGRMVRGRIRAFADGYASFRPLETGDIARALRIAGCIEFPWWIRRDVFESESPKLQRFLKEMRFLTEHWFELDDLIG